MINEILLILILIAIIYFLFIKKKPLKKNQEKKDKLQADDMVECQSCGVYSELGESILSNGKYYCSTECVNKEK